MAPITVLVHGVLGRMGPARRSPPSAGSRDLEPVGGVNRGVTESSMALPDGSGDMPISSDLKDMIARRQPQVMVDFTNATGAMEGCRVAAAHGVNLVVGATGLSEANLKELDALAKRARDRGLRGPKLRPGSGAADTLGPRPGQALPLRPTL